MFKDTRWYVNVTHEGFFKFLNSFAAYIVNPAQISIRSTNFFPGQKIDKTSANKSILADSVPVKKRNHSGLAEFDKFLFCCVTLTIWGPTTSNVTLAQCAKPARVAFTGYLLL